jgi:hypothetical protein
MENQIQTVPADNLMTAQQYSEMQAAQNLPMGILGGIVGAAIGAGLWAAITMAIDYQHSLMALGVGLLTGLGVRFFGKGREPIFGIFGAILALVGVLAGNLLFIHLLTAREFPGVQLTLAEYFEVLTGAIEPIDFLFYGLALYAGFRFSIVK